MNANKNQKPFLNPYGAGVFLGAVLLVSYLVLGAGLGASAGLARLAAYFELAVAPTRTLASSYFGRWGNQPLHYYLVFMLAGVFFGGLISAIRANRLQVMVERGGQCSPKKRLLNALIGGILVGFASRLASGCTSGQALSGTALLLMGSLLFLICLFTGGYVSAWFFRRQWND
jgi:uncharacterized membrane protein YedE/YeeE